ncbi:hypothetical protein EJB05_56785, partial [Eragrostis curvula]
MKVNVDAAPFKISSTCAAAVARDENGLFLRASSVVFSGVSDTEQLEALACRKALVLAVDLDLQQLRVAKCLNVVRNVHGARMGSYGQIIKEIKARMTNFTSIDIVHKGRESNVGMYGFRVRLMAFVTSSL